MKNCKWCKETSIKVMETGIKVPFICSGCGGKLGYADWKELQQIIDRSINQVNRPDALKDNRCVCARCTGIESYYKE